MSVRRSRFLRQLTSFGLLAAGLLAAACGGGGGSGGGGSSSGGQTSSGFDYPADIPGSPAGFFGDPIIGGGSGFTLVEVSWGRLVDIYDFDSTSGVSQLQHRNFVIGEEIFSDGVDYQIETNPVTEVTSVRILHKAGSPAYETARSNLDKNLGPVIAKGISPTELPPFSFVPRNAALVFRFNDLIDHHTLSLDTFRVLTGYPPSLPFEPRLLMDPNHGGLIGVTGGKEFRSTRIIVDTTVSELEAQTSSAALPVNSLGLPASINTSAANVGVRIPTQLSFATGQFALLKSTGGNPVSTVGGGPVDTLSPSTDVVRAMRSGSTGTADSNNGFLLDLNAPRIVGTQPINVNSVLANPAEGADAYLIGLSFQSTVCKATPQVGDVVQLTNVLAEVTQVGSPPDGSGTVNFLHVRLLTGNAASFLPGQASFVSVYDPGVDNSDCFLRVTPLPGKFPLGDVEPNSQIVLRFSEPMDPASVRPFDTFRVARTSVEPKLSELIVAQVIPSTDAREFRFVPVLPLPHAPPTAEKYFCTVLAGEKGVTDLAGNALATTGFQAALTIKTTAVAQSNGGVVLRFSSLNEDGDAANKAEVRTGQILFDLAKGVLRPRSVARVAAIADRSGGIVANMVAVPTGVQTPLSPLGSKLMNVYRYGDVGFSGLDETNYNVDIEHTNWSPQNGLVVADFYDGFEISLSHSNKLPDEIVDGNLLPQFPDSGLGEDSFDENVLVDPVNVKTVMHPKAEGFALSSSNIFLNSKGTLMMPWPVNPGNDPSEYHYYTWRDTAIRATGGPKGAGADYGSMVAVGLSTSAGQLAGKDNVPSIALPLLVETKCYPTEALGLTSLDVSIAINSSSQPYFRLFSTGGYDSSGNPKTKNPDLENKPSGGYCGNPIVCTVGQPTSGFDNVFYIGQLDLVYRVTRTHTIFFDTGNANPNYLDPVLEPRKDELPNGTDVVVAFRGATAITTGSIPLVDANGLDAYGDQAAGGTSFPTSPAPLYDSLASKNPSITFGAQGANWVSDVDSIDGQRFFQMRISFISNTSTNIAPELSAVGVAYLKN